MVELNGGTNAPIDLSQSGQGGREREDVRQDTFREGPEVLAVDEFERHEALQLTEPFGEWAVKQNGGTNVPINSC